MQRITDTTLLMAQASGAAGLVAATAWPAVLAGLWWGLALAWVPAPPPQADR
ncbi:hypothetical protein [Elioraea tepidiphila]|jgi:hypothetical protein|uniref:hypothetical protein n=1 Tax=Elioraea tepidiphila TaxID=457934 RepID=UPI002FDB1F6F